MSSLPSANYMIVDLPAIAHVNTYRGIDRQRYGSVLAKKLLNTIGICINVSGTNGYGLLFSGDFFSDVINVGPTA